jgi:hypothetical protein
VQGFDNPDQGRIAATDISSGSICYYCKKQGHFAYMCPKKLKTKIRNLIPSQYRKTWDEIVRRRRIPLGFVSVLPIDFVLLTYIKRFNQTRALYNPKVDKEIESIMMYEDEKFIGLCKEKWMKKEKTRASVVEAEEKNKRHMIQQIVKKVEEKNIIDMSKKINDVIQAKNSEKIPIEEAQMCVQQIAKDKKEHDDALNKLLDNFFDTQKCEIKSIAKKSDTQNNQKRKNSIAKKSDREMKKKKNNKKWEEYRIYKPYRIGNTLYANDGTFLDVLDSTDEEKEEQQKEDIAKKSHIKGHTKKYNQYGEACEADQFYSLEELYKMKQEEQKEKYAKKGKYIKDNEYIRQKKMDTKKKNQSEMMWNQFRTQQSIIDERHTCKQRYLAERHGKNDENCE